ncbi:pyroglutamylated RF-amide peptide receptor-like [Biomphalaria glabrata]|uniref:Pyroglutamylated RF-amide peptide receptor-like n=1 Tax=Biomphalaria glabrata TaxID=6526 RepID=A0A9W3AGC1_BIOGL|nr:pyroglutamylated RF-amide peptide receptor-like [Biomphalaria glabrata]
MHIDSLNNGLSAAGGNRLHFNISSASQQHANLTSSKSQRLPSFRPATIDDVGPMAAVSSSFNISLVDGEYNFNFTNGSNSLDYDYSDYDNSIPLDELLPVSLVYGVTLIVGVIGNLLVIAAVARDRRLRSITNIFLTSLACADLTLLCFCVPVKCIAFFSFSWAFGYFLCKAVHYLQIVAMICSVMTLTVMSIERNIAIMSPLRSKRICTRRRARVVVVLLWAGSIVLALPIFPGQIHKPVGALVKAYWCLKEWEKPIYGILFETYMLVLLFMVPVGVMVVSYTTICIELSRGTKFRRQATLVQCAPSYANGNSHSSRYSASKSQQGQGSCKDNMLQNRHKERMDQEKMKVIRMLIVVVVLFAVCWGPILINNLLVSVRFLNNLNEGHLKPLRIALFLLSYLNSSLNPLVYGFMSSHFRRGFREAICVFSRAPGSRLYRPGRANNSCYLNSDCPSIIRTGTVRLSPVTEQVQIMDEEDMTHSPVGSVRYGRKIWARSDQVLHQLQDK